MKSDPIWVACDSVSPTNNQNFFEGFKKKIVKCHFLLCGLGHFASLVQRFHFLHLSSKMFYRCHFNPLGSLHPFFC
ncbi:hypothetical protein Hanom_Chr03g00269701 [Helianthus anomalus]